MIEEKVIYLFRLSFACGFGASMGIITTAMIAGLFILFLKACGALIDICFRHWR